MLSRSYDWPLQANFAESSIVFDETGAVVTTDTASIDADYDNGATVPRSPRRGRRGEGAYRRLGAIARHGGASKADQRGLFGAV
jgi:hypothetical protein